MLYYLCIVTLSVNVALSLKTIRNSSDLVLDLPHCRYSEIKTNVTVDANGTCGCYTKTLMSKAKRTIPMQYTHRCGAAMLI